MKVKANGIEFNCKLDGKRGAPWVVFSNSLATNLSMWDEQAEALGDRFQILRYDQRGHGGTEAPFHVVQTDAGNRQPRHAGQPLDQLRLPHWWPGEHVHRRARQCPPRGVPETSSNARTAQ
mgnify:CR=1 FL=1